MIAILPHVDDFLDGRSFDAGYRLPICDRQYRVLSRESILEGLAQDAYVVHVGCADHLPLIEKKRSRGIWLHERLRKVARACIGIDLDHDAIAWLASLGIPDIYAADVTQDEVPVLAERVWDWFILGDVLEHVNDPIGFLAGIHRTHAKRLARLAISVPNPFARDTAKEWAQGREWINSDHRWWFTPYTLAKVARLAGWKALGFDWACPSGGGVISRCRRAFQSPMEAETLVMYLDPNA